MSCQRTSFATHFGIGNKDDQLLAGLRGADTWAKHKSFFVDSLFGKVRFVTVSYQVDNIQLMNGIGGALGLFLGFSILSTLTLFYQYVSGKWSAQ